MKKKELKKELENIGLDEEAIKEALEYMADGEDDFSVTSGREDWRFIKESAIDEIQQKELAGDPYVLGGLNSVFIADILGISPETVEKIQKKDEYTALGEILLPKIAEVQKKLKKEEGYGSHFAHYDYYDHTVGDYYAFRIK